MAGGKEAPGNSDLYMYRFPSLGRFQRCYPLVGRTTHYRAMLILLGSGKISHYSSGREGGTGAQRSLHIWISLNRRIPAVLSTWPSDHASQSYANLSRLGINQPLHQREGRRHHSTMFFKRMDVPQSHDSSGAIRLSIRPWVIELS